MSRPAAPRTCVLLLGTYPGESSAVNKQIVASIDATQHHPIRVNSGWLDDVPLRTYADARSFVTCKMNGSAAFTLEDPQLCRVWPFWLKVLAEANIRVLAIHALQPPSQIAEASRDLSTNERLSFWMRNTLDAEAIPVERLLLDGRAMTADSGAVSDRLQQWLAEHGIDQSPGLSDEIKRLLRRLSGHRAAAAPLEGTLGTLAELTYRVLSHGAAADCHDRALSVAMLQRIQRALDSAAGRTSAEADAIESDSRSSRDRHVLNLEALVGTLQGELAAVHRSTSWRLTAPLRVVARTWRKVLMRAGLRALVVGVRPGPMLERTRAGEFHATGDRPCLVLDFSRSDLPRGLPRGWYRLEVCGVESTRAFAPRLFVDSERAFYSPPFLHIRTSGRELRMEPCEGPARFRLEAIALTRVSALTVARHFVTPLMAIARRTPGYSRTRLREMLTVWREEGLEATIDRIVHYDDHVDGSFEQWVSRYDECTPERLRRYRNANDELPHRPRISIVLPVYNTPPRLLRRCIDSVLAQTYPNWELCIADDASTDVRVRLLLARYALRDRRIKTVRRRVNGHIAAASNSALKIATGEFVALLDHDDELAPFALYWIAASLTKAPDAGLLYSDEDKIDEDGRRSDPYFKPDWNPELLRAQNYVCHLTAYRRSIVVEAGGFREGFEGSQDWDLALRVTERCRPEQIVHIPRILYHWRKAPASTARRSHQKPYAAEAGQRAVAEALERAGLSAAVDKTAEGYHRIRYATPTPRPMASIIIPTRNGLSLLRTCLESIFHHTDYSPYEILVIDNQSDDPAAFEYFRMIAQRDNVRVLRFDEPFNFSAINNFGVAAARGDVLVLLNNDTKVLHRDWLHELVSLAAQPANGAVGVKLLYPDESIQHAGVVLGFGGVAAHIGSNERRNFAGQMSRCLIAQNLTAVTGACLAVRKTVYLEAGGLDAGELPIAFNDIDFCLKVAALGYRNVWTPHVELIHYESASRGYEDTPEKQARFVREVAHMIAKWGQTLRQDPAYNPSLDLDGRAPFTLAFPPRVTHEHVRGNQ